MPTRPANRLMPRLRRVVLAGSVNDRTDGQLLGAFVTDRDADAFAGLVRRHGPMVLGVCRRVTGDHTSADDAFQAVFLVLARRAAAIKPREQVGNWLYGVAYRTAIKARAVLARRRCREKQVEVMPEPPVAPADIWSDLQPVIDEELARLPDKLRMPVVLCDLEGRAQREVANHLGVPLATLASRLAAARRKLAERLTSRGVTLSGGALAGLLTLHGTASAIPHTLASGLAQAAEFIASGGMATSLVSPHAIQLSEGVIRMMLLSKLKGIAIAALTVFGLTCGLGLGLVPAVAGDDAPKKSEEKPGAPANTSSKHSSGKQSSSASRTEGIPEDVDDATFLRRLTLDLRGDQPTVVEMWFFVSDGDADKRAKVLNWLANDESIRSQLAKRLGVPEDRILLVRVADAKTGKYTKLAVVVGRGNGTKEKPVAAAFSPDGAMLAYTAFSQEGKILAQTVSSPDGKMLVTTAVNGAPVPAGSAPHVSRAAEIAYFMGSTGVAQPHYNLYRRQRLVATALPDTASTTNTAVPGGYFEDTKTAPGAGLAVGDFAYYGGQDILLTNVLSFSPNSDIDFLKRVLQDVRGTPPTSLEEKYFTEDKDPKKREKLLDTLLKDPAVAKKLGEDWKKKMLATPSANDFSVQPYLNFTGYSPDGVLLYSTTSGTAWANGITWANRRNLNTTQPGTNTLAPWMIPYATEVQGAPIVVDGKLYAPQAANNAWLQIPNTNQTTAQQTPQPSKLDKLVDELLAAKKTDAEMLEAVTLASLGRLPTDTEKRIALGLVSKTADRKAAWMEVAKALQGNESQPKR